MITGMIFKAVRVLDAAAQVVAWMLSKVSRVSGAGAFWDYGGPRRCTAWHDRSRRGGSWTMRLGRLELVADYRAAYPHEVNHKVAPRLTRWDGAAATMARVLDATARASTWLAGRIVASRRGYSAGVFFWQDQPAWREVWREPGSFNVRLGRLELNVDMPR
jgi:hypothetical protein